ncbi:aspartate aminotransferase family protein [Helicobacter winghamensis]|uniref:Acetylornithine aminotransferase n=2 Tax=Helicobacter winghamensis TaxID=157268 RepID=A0A2N3PHF8_9HELI|nr:aspartate aminotransferase family protein [Helicobacter winghamensis]PKT75430.1 acetylornithine aminotransferase [Helicobacter winghamensis]PKT75598.1 acetylornithine aminotransferase [Helicobacter winghamensis]PKT79466.1 acetylornithine aminotransferase [Helicobacter winghamensis]PKT79811.1 acetylornithine aminotransferase [Helicobacter winghamensis]PKT79894.1 acetylornithine aminotransferase [Helicobacter winghamensis]
MNAQTLKQMDLDYVLHTYARNYVHFVRGSGARLFDEMGKDYIDFGSGIAVCSVGHGNKRLADALYKQAQNLIHTSNLYLIEPQAKLAKKLVELSGYDMRVFFANSGAEANEGALKIARKFGEVNGELKRYQIITLDSSFHGRTISTLKATGQDKMHNYFGPFPDGFVYAKDLNDIPNKISNVTCAVLLELVQGEGGITPFNKQEVQDLAKLLKEKNILLMVDEVQTGIYRSGELFASQAYGITPDVITTAKGLAGGVPIGAVLTSLKDIFSPSDHGSTFGGNFLSTAAALEVLEILSALKASGELDKTIAYFSKKLQDLQKNHSAIFTQEVGLGLMRGLRVRDAETLSAFLESSFNNGVLVLKSGKNTARFLPSLTITKEEIDLGFERLEFTLKDIY